MDIDQIINQVHFLPEASLAKLKENITEIKLPKGHLLFRIDKIETTIYFIKKGIVRAFAFLDDTEITVWFGKEGDTAIFMKSYVEKEKGYENIELLEDCELYELKTKHLQELFENDINIANWGRRFAEKELVKTEERFISRQCQVASKRYLNLIADSPDLLQRVQLGHIASYLGITQVSLSRIRGEIK